MSSQRAKLQEIAEKLCIAQATAFVLREALSSGDTDLELQSSDVLGQHRELLTDCLAEITALANAPSPRPPGRRRAKPTESKRPALSVVKSASNVDA